MVVQTPHPKPPIFTTMKITSLIAQHLIDVHEGNNWTDVSIADTLKDVTAEEAAVITQASPNTIASLLHHITFWNRLMIKRMQGIDIYVDEKNGYDAPSIKTEADWQQLQVDNNLSAHELAAAIAGFDENLLPESLVLGGSSAYKNLQGTVEHVHYHLGQMVIIKKLIKATK